MSKKHHKVKPKENSVHKVIPFQDQKPTQKAVIMQPSQKEFEQLHTVRQLKNVPGVIEIVLEHECKKTSGAFRSHVKIPPDEWNKVLAFFKWTYDTWKSESQVRLFANTTNGEIRAWAFPQKADTGMTAKEIEDHENFGPQRAQFPDPTWLYFGTVHHHCDGGAFQSHTDREDETTKDGLHITVGKLGGQEYDMDARLYILKHKFVPDMSLFYDVSGMRAEWFPDWTLKFAPPDDIIARMLMCQPAPAETVIPQQWKDNVITPPPVIVHGHCPAPHWSDDFRGGVTNNWSNGYHEGKREYLDRTSQVFDVDLHRCISDLGNYMKRRNEANAGTKNWKPMTREMLFEIFEIINQLWDDDMMNVFDILARHDLRPEALEAFWKKKITVDNTVSQKTLKLPEPAGKSNGTHAGEGIDSDDPCPSCGLRGNHHQVNCSVVQERLQSRGSLPE